MRRETRLPLEIGVQFFELRRREDDFGGELLEPFEVVVEGHHRVYALRARHLGVVAVPPVNVRGTGTFEAAADGRLRQPVAPVDASRVGEVLQQPRGVGVRLPVVGRENGVCADQGGMGNDRLEFRPLSPA